MGAPFSVRALFLRVGNSLLKTYFERRHELLDFPWNRFALGTTDPLYEAWCALPADARAQSEAEFRAVAELATTEGIGHILERGRDFGLDLHKEVARRDGLEHKVLWTLVAHREVFQAAREICHVEQMNGRYWRARAGLPRRAPDVSAQGIDALKAALSGYYRRREARGSHCDVHWHVRDGRHYLMAYPEDHARTVLGWEGGLLGPVTHRPAFEVAFVYDALAGTLELNARGDKQLHADLQQIFTRTLLGVEIPRFAAVARTLYLLNRLKQRDLCFPTDPADGIRSVRIQRLRLAPLGGGSIDIKAPPARAGASIYDLMDAMLREEQIPMTNVNIDCATIQLEFAWPRPGHELNVSMWPHRTNLGDKPEHQLIRTYLPRWELCRA